MPESVELEKYKEIKLGDSVCRIMGTYKPPVNVIYGQLQEGVVVKIEKSLPDKKCIAGQVGEELCFCEKHIKENPVNLHVARNGDKGFVQLMPYDQVVKIEKEFPKSVNGHMKLF